LLAAARYRAPRQAPGLPILLLASQHDKLVDSRCSQALAAAWRCPLEMHPTAGHDLPLDDPHWVAQQVLGWMPGDTAALAVCPPPAMTRP
jgi:pimeloyl-ACP methyl ester carboxylesterase